jgi:hypothetical protein
MGNITLKTEGLLAIMAFDFIVKNVNLNTMNKLTIPMRQPRNPMKITLLAFLFLTSTALFPAAQAPKPEEELDAKSRAAALPKNGPELYDYLTDHDDSQGAAQVVAEVDARDVDTHGNRTHEIINWVDRSNPSILELVMSKNADNNNRWRKTFQALLKAGVKVQRIERTTHPVEHALDFILPQRPPIVCDLLNAGADKTIDADTWATESRHIHARTLPLLLEASNADLTHILSTIDPAHLYKTTTKLQLYAQAQDATSGDGKISFEIVLKDLFIRHFTPLGHNRRKQRALNIEAQNTAVISALDSCITVPGLLAIINSYIPPRYTLAAPPEKLLHVGGPLTEEEAEEEQENKQRQSALIASTKTASSN